MAALDDAEGVLRVHQAARRMEPGMGVCETCGQPWPCPARVAASRVKAAATIAAEREEDEQYEPE